LTVLSEVLQTAIKDVSIGCTVLDYFPEADPAGTLACSLQVLVWRGETNVRTLVSKDDRKFFCALLDIPNDDDTPAPRKRTAEEAAEADAGGGAADDSAPKRIREDAVDKEAVVGEAAAPMDPA
jgi:hypothetical protein